MVDEERAPIITPHSKGPYKKRGAKAETPLNYELSYSANSIVNKNNPSGLTPNLNHLGLSEFNLSGLKYETSPENYLNHSGFEMSPDYLNRTPHCKSRFI